MSGRLRIGLCLPLPLLALLGTTGPLSAQDGAATVTARLEPAAIRAGQTVDLVVEVVPGGVTSRIEEPELPELAAAVVGQSRESQVQLDGGGMSRRVIFRYRLRPMTPGALWIDPIRVVVDGRAFQTPALELAILPDGSEGGETPGLARERIWEAEGPPPFFVTARVDRGRALIGEQVTLTFAFYHDPRVPLAESPDYDPPATPGFWRLEIDREPRVDVERIGRRAYHVQRFRYALFPLREGPLTIGPATVRIVEPDPARWWRSGDTRTLETDPLRITAEPLPSGAPRGFAGAVGNYALDGGVRGGRATVGIPLELALTVSGQGNPTAVGAPLLPAWPDVDVQPPSIETETRVRRAKVGGETTFRYLLSPRAAGRLDLGSARFAFYDPLADGYVVDTIALGEIEVLPGSAGAPAPTVSPRPTGPTLWAVREPIAPAPAGLAREVAYWAALAGPWLAWLAVAGFRQFRSRHAEWRAGRAPLARLAQARRALVAGEPGAAAAALKAIDAALAARFVDRVPADADQAAREARATLAAAAYSDRPVPESSRALERLEATLGVGRRGMSHRPPPGGKVLLAVALASTALASTGPAAGETDPPAVDRWKAANQAYRSGAFGPAAEAYRSLLRSTPDPRLEADLAAALWRFGERGEAVLHYHHALRLAPRSGVIRGDLARLRTELGNPPRAGSGLQLALDRFRLDEILAALLTANTLAFGLVVAAARRRRGRGLALGGVTLVVALAALAAVAAHTRSATLLGVALRPAVMTAEPANGSDVHGGPPALGSLAEGSVIEILDRSSTGWRIRAPGAPAGWVASDRIVPLDWAADPGILH
ncbi:MAG TPA: BatD family protein [Gemmatimonadota bacterium]|nr:BatD family protein [Gemmatimonadota bacterium]